MLGNVKIEEKTMQHIFQSVHEVEKKINRRGRAERERHKRAALTEAVKLQTSVVLALCHIKLILYLHKLN